MKNKSKKYFNRKILSIATITLAFGTMISASGCDFVFARTEDDVYRVLSEALEDFFGYSKAMTVEMVIEGSIKDSRNTYDVESTIKFSTAPTSKQMFMTMENTVVTQSGSVDSQVEVKLFEENGQHYLYQMASAERPGTNGIIPYSVEYNKVTDSYIDQVMSIGALNYFSENDIEELFQEYIYNYSFTEVKNAYESVYAEQLAEQQKEDKNAKATVKLSANNTKGILKYEFATEVDARNLAQGHKVKKFYEEKTVGENNKITEVSMKSDISLSRLNGGSAVMSATEDVTMKISYEFDETGFNGIETEAPSGGLTHLSNPTGGIIGITLDVGGCVTDRYMTDYGAGISGLFSDLTQGFKSDAGHLIEWYTDENHTTPFEPKNLSRKEFKETDKVYGKVTVKDGYAICAIDYEVKDERSDAYKIVFGKVNAHYNGEEYLYSANLAKNENYTFIPLDDYIHEIYVNGIKQEDGQTGISLADKGFYHVEYMEKVNDDGFSIFDVDFSLFDVLG